MESVDHPEGQAPSAVSGSEPQTAPLRSLSSRLTAGRLAAIRLPRAAIGRRGVDDEAVARLREAAQEALDRSEREIDHLHEEIRRLHSYIRTLWSQGRGAGPTDDEASPTASAEARALLGRARERAEECLAEAQREAARRLEEADAQARALMESAEAESSAHADAAARACDPAVPVDVIDRQIGAVGEALDRSHQHSVKAAQAALDEWARAQGCDGAADVPPAVSLVARAYLKTFERVCSAAFAAAKADAERDLATLAGLEGAEPVPAFGAGVETRPLALSVG